MIDFTPVAAGYSRLGDRLNREIWNLVGNDPGIIMFGSLYKELEFHIGLDDAWEHMEKEWVEIWIAYELALYDKLAAKHKKPSAEYADVVASAQ